MNIITATLSIGLVVGMAGADVARAADLNLRAPQTRRQLIDCMTRQMSASRSISYIEAAKLCKAAAKDLASQPPAPTSGDGMQKTIARTP